MWINRKSLLISMGTGINLKHCFGIKLLTEFLRNCCCLFPLHLRMFCVGVDFSSFSAWTQLVRAGTQTSLKWYILLFPMRLICFGFSYDVRLIYLQIQCSWTKSLQTFWQLFKTWHSLKWGCRICTIECGTCLGFSNVRRTINTLDDELERKNENVCHSIRCDTNLRDMNATLMPNPTITTPKCVCTQF